MYTTVSNNGHTQNFQTLLLKTLDLVAGSQKNEARASAATNGVYLLRVLVKRLSESLNAVQLAAFSTDTPYIAADIQPSEHLAALLPSQMVQALGGTDLCCLFIVQRRHCWISCCKRS